jgi:trimeric autotransporter adhesin
MMPEFQSLKNIIYTFIKLAAWLCIFMTGLHGQSVGIGTTSPHNSAQLDITSTNKGILIPRLSTTARTTMPTPAKGLLVFDNDTNTFWYHDGTTWQNMAGAVSGNNWGLMGNTGTSASNFIGTTDAQPLRFKINGGSAGIIDSLNSNTALGLASLRNNVGTGNTAMGSSTLSSNLVGVENTANGWYALHNNTDGGYNSAIGSSSLYTNTRGSYNAALGNAALFKNTTGQKNIAIGTAALYNNTDRSNLVAIGDSALYNNGVGATFYNEAVGNTAVGSKALLSNIAGSNNTAIGYASLYKNTYGIENTANGSYAMYNNLTGFNNTANGYASLYNNTTGSYNTANGYSSLSSNTIGNDNTANGAYSLYENTTGSSNTANGNGALYSNTIGSDNTANGFSALKNNTTGSLNIANGTSTLFSNTSGYENTAIGYHALYSNTIGFKNIAIGSEALYYNIEGLFNTAIGTRALWFNSTGSSNTATGIQALLLNTTGTVNTANGSGALENNRSGNFNTANGAGALSSNVYGFFNTASGYASGSSLIDPTNNVTCLGYRAGSATTLSNHINIGNGSITFIGGQVGWSNYSDGRIKNNVQENVPGLSFIRQLRPVTYNLDIVKQDAIANLRNEENAFIENVTSDAQQGDRISKKSKAPNRSQPAYPEEFDIEKLTQTGFIAQEVEAAAKNLGLEFSGVQAPKDGKGLYTIRYADFVMPLVKGMQEQQQLIENQQAQIEALHKELSLKSTSTVQLQNLQAQIDDMKKLLQKN